MGDGRGLGPALARRRHGRCHLRGHLDAAGAQHRHGHSLPRQQPAPGAAAARGLRRDRDRAPDRARQGLDLSGERKGTASPRCPAPVRRRRLGRPFDRPHRPGPDRLADQRQAGRTSGTLGRSRRDQRAAGPPARGGAAPGRGRDQSGSLGRHRRESDGADRPAEEAGASGRALSPLVRADPAGGGAAALPALAGAQHPAGAGSIAPGRIRAAGRGDPGGSRSGAGSARDGSGRSSGAARRRRCRFAPGRAARHGSPAAPGRGKAPGPAGRGWQPAPRPSRSGSGPRTATGIRGGSRTGPARRRGGCTGNASLCRSSGSGARRGARSRGRSRRRRRRSRRQRSHGPQRCQARRTDGTPSPPDRDRSSVSADQLADAAASVASAEQAVAAARQASEAAKAALEAARAAETEANLPVRALERRSIGLRAEIAALKSVASAGLGRGFAPVLDRISVAAGLETALGAGLGDDLLAALDSAAPVHWASLAAETGEPEPLPDGAEPLARSVEAPALLARRLARIGVVADAETGTRLQAALRPGQRLVSRDGAAWRWDGLRIAAGAPTAAALRLAQRNRLRELDGLDAALERELAEAQAARRAAAAALTAAQQEERAGEAALQRAGQALAAARQAQTVLAQQQAQAQLRRQAAEEAIERLGQERDESRSQALEIEQETALLPDPAEDQHRLGQLRADLARLRDEDGLQRRTLDRLARDAAAGRARLGAIEVESRAWRLRTENAAEHCTTLARRRAVLVAEAADIAQRPRALAQEKSALLAEIAAGGAVAETAAARLRAAEQAASAAEQAAQAGAARHAEAREQRVRAEAGHEQALEALAAASARARENFDCPAEHLPRVAGIPADAGGEPTSEFEARFDRLRREREAIGPVNLTAETEMAELAREHESITTQSADLVAAIAKLRQGIRELSREGGERLQRAFEIVNEHFQALFVRLFGGGRAYLELALDPADPFTGGLEIMASPPGKKLQMLSLLSGGERALTALALVFAVFLTNPAPISVLDEVDAPLDDANVERFCHLVREIGERTGTRFLIITHHRVSMAVMDRLYGVTMVEKGVSRLVSVELAAAERLRQTG